MEDQRNIHYRVGGRLTHCGAECLPNGKDIERIIIARIEYKESEMINGRTEKGVWVAYFAQNPYTNLPMILNATNRKRLVKLFPECEGYPARLQNVPVRLTKELTRDAQDGGDTWGLRISKLPAAPEAAPHAKVLPILTADKIEAAKNWMAQNGKTIEDVKKQYQVPADLEAKLKESDEDLPD